MGLVTVILSHSTPPYITVTVPSQPFGFMRQTKPVASPAYSCFRTNSMSPEQTQDALSMPELGVYRDSVPGVSDDWPESEHGGNAT